MKKQNITIHGSTGTIGKNALSVIAKSSNQYKVFALSAKSKIKTLYNQIKKFTPKYAVVLSKEKARNLSYLCANNNISTKILFGTDSYNRISSDRRVAFFQEYQVHLHYIQHMQQLSQVRNYCLQIKNL